MQRLLGSILGPLCGLAAMAPAMAIACEGPLEAPEALVEQLVGGDYWAAYDSLSAGYRDTHDFRAFIGGVALLGLDQATDQDWSVRAETRDRVFVDGQVDIADGRRAAMQTELVEGADGGCVVDSFTAQIGTPDSMVPRALAHFPSRDEVQVLVRHQFYLIGTALLEDDLSTFYDSLAVPFQEQTSQEQLLGLFRVYAPVAEQLRLLAAIPPVFEPLPRLNEDQVLVLSGYFPTQPDRIHFHFQFVLEDSDWRLLDLYFGPQPPPEELFE